MFEWFFDDVYWTTQGDWGAEHVRNIRSPPAIQAYVHGVPVVVAETSVQCVLSPSTLGAIHTHTLYRGSESDEKNGSELNRSLTASQMQAHFTTYQTSTFSCVAWRSTIFVVVGPVMRE